MTITIGVINVGYLLLDLDYNEWPIYNHTLTDFEECNDRYFYQMLLHCRHMIEY